MKAKTEILVSCLAIALKMEVPIFLWSAPGEGKSSVIQSLARSRNIHSEILLGSSYEPTDFLGIPFISNNEMHYSIPPWAKRIVEASEKGMKTLAFFDELPNARPDAQAGSLRVTQEKIVGDGVRLPQDMLIVAAGNPVALANSSVLLKPANRNRFLHMDWGLDSEYYRNGITKGFPDVQFPLFPRKEILESKLNLIKAFLGAFIMRNPQRLSSNEERILEAEDSPEFEATDMAFPSPRTWEFVAKVYTAAKFAVTKEKEPLSPEVAHILVAGCVGKAEAVEFISFIEKLDLPDPRGIIMGSDKWSSENKRSDIVYAACASMVNHLRERLLLGKVNDATKIKMWNNLANEFSLIASEGNTDIVIPFTGQLMNMRPQGVIPQSHQVDYIPSFINRQ